MSSRMEASTSASGTPVPTTTVGTKRKAEDALEDALRSRLECSVCYNLMLPPIRQCAEGHNFCDRCATKLMTGTAPSSRKCPTCRIALSNPVARARNLEEWASEANIEVTCDYAACGMRFRYSACAEHQRSCLGRTVACPRRGCSWRGESSRLAHHLQNDDCCVKLAATPIPAKYSERHKDYSTTVIFETKRVVGDKRRWCPPRQLILVPANARLGTSPAAFCVALWKPRGRRQPFLAAIQLLRKPGGDEVPFSFDLSMSAYPRPPERMCVSRASAVGTCAELDSTEVWRRPRLHKCCSPVLAADAASMAIFNTAGLSVNESGSLQRYELHVRLMPLIEPTDPEEAPHESYGDDDEGEEGDDDEDEWHDFNGLEEGETDDGLSDDDVDGSDDGSSSEMDSDEDDDESDDDDLASTSSAEESSSSESGESNESA